MSERDFNNLLSSQMVVQFVCLCWGLTSQSTIFQSCRDGATASWVINQYFRGVKCLAQGHNTAAVGIEPPTSRSGVRHSTTEPPRSPGCSVLQQVQHSYKNASNYKPNEPPHDKTNKMTVRPAKTQISLGIRPVWSESSLCAQWVAKDPSFFHADRGDSDQTERMSRLIWVFAGRWFCHEPTQLNLQFKYTDSTFPLTTSVFPAW